MSRIPQPCSATCMHHHSHPCEKCGRQWGDIVPLVKQIAELEARIKELENGDLTIAYMCGFSDAKAKKETDND